MSRMSAHSSRKTDFDKLSREQLVEGLCDSEDRFLEMSREQNEDEDEYDKNVHNLQVHKLELEMQNKHMQETQMLLEESRSKYAELYEHCPASLVSVDLAGRIVQANASTVDVLGVDHPELIGAIFARYVILGDRTRFTQALRRCFNVKESEKFNDVVSLNGRCSTRSMHVSMKRNANLDGGVPTVSVSMMDVSEYFRLNERVAFIASVGEQFSKTLELDSATDLILNMAVPHLADLAALTFCGEVLVECCPREKSHVNCDESLWSQKEKHRIFEIFMNSKMAVMCLAGFDRVDWRSGGASECFSNEDLEVLSAHYVGHVQAWPLSRRGENLGVLWLVWSEIKSEQALAAPSVLHDFMHRAALSLDNVSLYLVAQNQIKARSDFLAIVAHDLRNPLTVISMRVERMLQTKKLEDRSYVTKSAEAIGRCADRMGDLVRDLLDATSMDSRRLSMVPRKASIEEIIEDEFVSHVALAESKGLSLFKETKSKAEMFCDPRRAGQVVNNLIGNAIKFTESGGSVMLRTEVLEDAVQISVHDTGCGMDEHVQAKIFDPFWQAKPSSRSGVGLGLNICRKIVDASGGKIWFTSTTGKGSAFYVTFPRFETKRLAKSIELAPAARILMVDDDESYRLTMSEVLQEQGYEVFTAENGQCALDWLRCHGAPNLILLDLQMPVMDGFTFLEHVARDQALNKIPVTVLSSAVHEVNIAQSDRVHVLYKMTPLQDVLRAIATVQGCAACG